MYNAFDDNFHLLVVKELPVNSFELNGKPYDVPCVFQIWIKDENRKRARPQVEVPNGFKYVKPDEPYDIVVRRVGANAGKTMLFDSINQPNRQTHYFISFADELIGTCPLGDIVAGMNQHTFPTNTVGPRSLSKAEVTVVLNNLIN
jgi:hypothetical protein